LEITEAVIDNLMSSYFPENSSGADPDLEGFAVALNSKFALMPSPGILNNNSNSALRQELLNQVTSFYENKEKSIGLDLMRHLERMVFLQIIDAKWKDHLYAMDSLREGIGLRAYGQRVPLVEYKREAFGMFSQMVALIEEESVEAIFKLELSQPQGFRGAFSSVHQELLHPEITGLQGPQEGAIDGGLADAKEESSQKTVKLSHPKVGRNDPCPCGSGKKYKKCCGK
jgi:preprotein translocase subunit SecA